MNPFPAQPGTAKPLLLLLTMLVCSLISLPATAQQEDKKASRERAALRQLQMERQQMSGQLQSLEAEKAKLAQEAAEKGKELEGTKAALKKRESAEGKLRGELKTRLSALRTEMEKVETRYQEVANQVKTLTDEVKQRDTTITQRNAQIRDLDAQLNAQREIVGRQVKMLAESESKNRQLAQIARDLMAKYKDKGLIEAALHKEPFTQIERVRMQNALNDYSEKIDDLRIAQPNLDQ